MTVRTFTDGELLQTAEAVTLPHDRAKIRAFAREIIRLREALREIERVAKQEAAARITAARMTAAGSQGESVLEISAKALGLL